MTMQKFYQLLILKKLEKSSHHIHRSVLLLRHQLNQCHLRKHRNQSGNKVTAYTFPWVSVTMNVFCCCTNDTLPFSTVRRGKDFCDKLLSMSNVSFKLSVSFEGSFSLDDDNVHWWWHWKQTKDRQSQDAIQMKSKTKWQEIRKEETTSKWLWQCRSFTSSWFWRNWKNRATIYTGQSYFISESQCFPCSWCCILCVLF
jgi:hypothetical protein